MTEPERVVVVRGCSDWRVRSTLASLAVGALAFLSLVQMSTDAFLGAALPWTLRDRTHFLDRHAAVPFAIVLGSVALSGLAARRFFRSRAGTVELRDDRVVIEKGSGLRDYASVPWAEIAGFRDGSAAFVQLVRSGELAGGSLLAVPTPTGAERVAVLEFLVARGIARLEGRFAF